MPMKVNFNRIRFSTIIYIGIGLAVVLIVFSVVMSNIKDSYAVKINDYRKQKDEHFKSSADSPIMNKESFKGLSYFEPDKKYQVKADVSLLDDTIPITILRSDGKRDNYIRYALATFLLDDKEYNLVLLQHENESEPSVLFLPFADKTNGESSYESGRYIDLKYKNTPKITIDFNFAYNPYCAYNYKYSCPIPPKENFLDVAIPAGEKAYKGN